MRKSLVGSVSALLTGAGLALAQPAPAPRALPLALPAAADSAPQSPAPSGDHPPAGVVAAPADAAGWGPMIGDWGHEATMPAPGRFYADAEYLFWFTRPTKLPPLVLQGDPATPGETPTLGANGTTVLVGDKEIDAGARSGARLRVGYWFDADQTVGLEASGFYLEQIGSTFGVVSNGASALGLSFQDASLTTVPNETSLLIAQPGLNSGSALVHTSTKFWGADINAACNAVGSSWYRADALFGFRYLRLQEDLTIDSTTNSTPPFGFVTFQGNVAFDPASLAIADAFRTTNDFYGGQVGAHILLQKGIWYADFRGMLAAGVTHQSLTTVGSTTLTTPTGSTTVPGGLYVQQTNMGHFSNDEFTIIPEGMVTVGCQVTHYLRVYVGYSALYWHEGVVRPATELDRLVPSTAIPALSPAPLGTETHPAPQLQRVDFWAQGVQFGVEIDF